MIKKKGKDRKNKDNATVFPKQGPEPKYIVYSDAALYYVVIYLLCCPKGENNFWYLDKICNLKKQVKNLKKCFVLCDSNVTILH